LVATDAGLTYRASEQAAPFLRLVDSPHLSALREVAAWVASELGGLSTDDVRRRIQGVASQWTEQWIEDSPAWLDTADEEREEQAL
jgi:hypothetical protein